MPLFSRPPKTPFVYEGYFAGLVPVYIGHLDRPDPDVQERWPVPEGVFMTVVSAVQASMALADLLGVQTRGFPLRIDRRLDGRPLSQDPHLKD